MQAKREETEVLSRAAAGAEASAQSARDALEDCQEMLAEMQAFSETKQAAIYELEHRLQVCTGMHPL